MPDTDQGSATNKEANREHRADRRRILTGIVGAPVVATLSNTVHANTSMLVCPTDESGRQVPMEANDIGNYFVDQQGDLWTSIKNNGHCDGNMVAHLSGNCYLSFLATSDVTPQRCEVPKG